MRTRQGSTSNLTLSNISVILVGTLQGGNIGSVARAMHNMGLGNLKLVSPERFLNRECQRMAGKAMDIVRQAKIYSSLEKAVAEENVLVGTTSARDRKPKQRFYTPREIAPIVWEYAQSQRLGLVFGPERSGLTDDQLARCQYLAHVPANPDYPVLNLAQAVMILGYEIFQLKGSQFQEHGLLASDEHRERMFRHVEQVLIAIGFLSSGNPAPIMRAIRRFLGRADLAPRDVQIIRGIMSHMEWHVRRGCQLPAQKVRKP